MASSATSTGTSFFASVDPAGPRAADSSLPFDFGPPAPVEQRAGVSVVGSQPYVTNLNIAIGGEGAQLKQQVAVAARHLRKELGVQCMALPYVEGQRPAGGSQPSDAAQFEIGCNLQAGPDAWSPSSESIVAAVRGALPESARVVRSYVVGLTPGGALQEAKDRLRAEIADLPLPDEGSS